MEKNHILSSSKTLALNPSCFSCCAIMSSFLLFIKLRKEEREEYEEMVTGLSLLGNLEGAFISCCDKVPLSRVMGRTITPTGLGDLVRGCLFLGGEVRSWSSEPLS